MQKTIHGADGIVISSKPSPKERLPALERVPDASEESDSDSEVVVAGLEEINDGLSWLDEPAPETDNMSDVSSASKTQLNLVRRTFSISSIQHQTHYELSLPVDPGLQYKL
jgi:hypothetical protein